MIELLRHLEDHGFTNFIVSGGDRDFMRPVTHAGGKGRPALRLLLNHDDADREFRYTAGAEDSLVQAAAKGWTVISMKDDWATVFTEARP